MAGNEIIRLNIGAGDTKIEGFTPIDRKLGTEAYPLDYADGSVDEIRASHIVEHFTYAEAVHAMKEWFRVLKPGGRIRVAVPDVDKVFAQKKPGEADIWRFHLMGGQTDENDIHKSAWDRDALERLLYSAGFGGIDTFESTNTDSASLPISLNLEAFKPGDKPIRVEKFKDIKICAVTSIPRIGWNDHWGCIVDALRPFKMPIRRFTGAYWGQCMQNVLEQCVEDKLDWVLTLDYDTMFTARDVDRLLGYMGQNPEIDAIAALQCRRGSEFPLITIKGQKHAEYTGAPIRVDTAHFGLTLLRLDALSGIPKPWFMHKPGPDGTWTHDDRMDDDIWFWHQWREHGRKLFVAPDVRVGHLELMVAEFDENLQQRHVHVRDWLVREKGDRNVTDLAAKKQEIEYATPV